MKDPYLARISRAINEAARFIKRAEEALQATSWDDKPREKRAAMKRASMDLTKELAKLRKPEQP